MLSGAQKLVAAGTGPVSDHPVSDHPISDHLDRLWSRCPLTPIAAACIAGVLLDANLTFGTFAARYCAIGWCALGTAMAAFYLARPRATGWSARITLVLLFLPGGAAAHRVSDLRYQSASILSIASEDSQPTVVEGIIDRPSNLRRDPFHFGSGEAGWQTVIELNLNRVRIGQQNRHCDGRLAVIIGGRCDHLAPGDSIRVLGTLRALRGPTNPGAVDLRDVYRRRSLHARLDVDSIDDVKVISQQRAPIRRAVAALAAFGREQLLACTGKETGPLAVALVVGQRDLVDNATRDRLLVTGTAHLLSVSGLHLAIVVMLAHWAAILLRMPMFPKLVWVLLVCLLYTAITGARPPVLRAAVLVGSLLLATWIRKPNQPFNTLSLAAILLVLFNPKLVFSVGVHLSFLAVATLLMCGGPNRRTSFQQAVDRERQLNDLVRGVQTPLIRAGKVVARKVFELIWFSGCVTTISLPLVWHHFHVVSFVSILANVILTPMLFLALGSGIALILLGWIAAPLEWFCGSICAMSLWMIQSVIRVAAEIPGGHFWLPSPPMWLVAIFYLVLVGAMLLPPGRWSSRFRYGWILCWFISAWMLSLRPAPLEEATTEATFVDVGHGTSVIVRLAPDEVWLYDCGRLGNQHHSSRGIDCALWSLGVTRLRGVILSHADADHFNALPGLLRRFSVERIVTPPGMLQEDESSLVAIRRAIAESRIPVDEVSAGMSIVSKGRWIDVLHPPSNRVAGSDNANSMVVQIDSGQGCLILPGDLEAPGTAELIDQPRPPAAGVLMAPHHGSLTTDADAVLHWARPREVIVSGGRRASRPAVAEKLAVTGSGVHTTSTSGAIRVRIDRHGRIDVHRWLDSPRAAGFQADRRRVALTIFSERVGLKGHSSPTALAASNMLSILREISITCFFTSYLVVLVLELLRLAGRIPGRALLVIVMMVVGLFTHVCYLVLQASAEGVDGAGNEAGLWATWSDWSLLLALGLAVCFLIAYLRRPDTMVSYFFLPAVMAMIGFAIAVRNLAPFTRSEAVEVWRSVHAFAMMVGSGAVLIGFIAGIMYLVQSRRLKQKRAGSSFRLPTLESLGRLNRRCLIISTTAVGVGLLAGIVMNLNRWGQIGLADRGVLLSLLLLLWLCGATCLEYFYEPASHGRKAVYLTLASLGFLILAMIGVLTTPHGQNPDELSRHIPRPDAIVASVDPLTSRQLTSLQLTSLREFRR